MQYFMLLLIVFLVFVFCTGFLILGGGNYTGPPLITSSGTYLLVESGSYIKQYNYQVLR